MTQFPDIFIKIPVIHFSQNTTETESISAIFSHVSSALSIAADISGCHFHSTSTLTQNCVTLKMGKLNNSNLTLICDVTVPCKLKKRNILHIFRQTLSVKVLWLQFFWVGGYFRKPNIDLQEHLSHSISLLRLVNEFCNHQQIQEIHLFSLDIWFSFSVFPLHKESKLTTSKLLICVWSSFRFS